MFEYPLERYRFYEGSDGRVFAVTTYCGKTVRASAKCSPNDTFDINIGKELAAARCNLKVAEKRNKCLAIKAKQAYEFASHAMANAACMDSYLKEAMIAYQEARARVEELETEN